MDCNSKVFTPDTLIGNVLKLFDNKIESNPNYFENNIKVDKFLKQIKFIMESELKEELGMERIADLKSRSYWLNIHTQFQLFLDKFFPKTQLVSLPDPESILSIMASREIFIPNEKYKIILMQRSKCHDNVEELCNKNSNKKFRSYSGYALSEDRLWRYHSWIVDENNNIIETTVKRLVYIGFHQKI